MRSAILLLILRPLRDASPDAAKFSHMLLGFDVADHPRSLSNTRSLPGGVNATSHCFGVMLSLLDSPSFAVIHPHQARLALEILYRLVSSRFTAERTLQYDPFACYFTVHAHLRMVLDLCAIGQRSRRTSSPT